MNRAERRAFMGRIRAGIATEKERRLFSKIKNAISRGNEHKEVCRELRVFAYMQPRTKTERNRLKAIRRARARA